MTSPKYRNVPAKGNILAVPALSLALAGCMSSTVIPKETPPPAVASFSGNEQNGGVLSLGTQGAVVDAGFLKKYDTVIAQGYGKHFTPPLKKGDGVVPYSDGRGDYLIDKEHLVLALRMFDKKGNGEAP